ncbi:MAG: FHA domain-containing protein [Oceanococcus sp.]
MHSESVTRHCGVLIVDIARTVELRNQLGEIVAGEKIRNLLADIVAYAKTHGGEFIKSYGDDVMVIFPLEPKLTSAARVAIRAHQLALDNGLQLYAGVHAGEVEFRETMGHPDALGQTINVAARLHKLTENAPGRIYLTATNARELPPDLQALSSAFGAHNLKGLGPIDVWTLDWRSSDSTPKTVFSTTASHELSDLAQHSPELWLEHRSMKFCLSSETPRYNIGRDPEAQLCIMDHEVRVSSQHLLIESASKHWFAQDVSRNGTWLYDERVQEETILPKGHPFSLPSKGRLCLGRPFEADPDMNFTIKFEIKAA